jgi:hypothetical protein
MKVGGVSGKGQSQRWPSRSKATYRGQAGLSVESLARFRYALLLNQRSLLQGLHTPSCEELEKRR